MPCPGKDLVYQGSVDGGALTTGGQCSTGNASLRAVLDAIGKPILGVIDNAIEVRSHILAHIGFEVIPQLVFLDRCSGKDSREWL